MCTHIYAHIYLYTHIYMWYLHKYILTMPRIQNKNMVPLHSFQKDLLSAYLWHDSFAFVTRLLRVYDMTFFCVRHYSFTFVTWLLRVCDMTFFYVRQDSFTYATWLLRVRDMTFFYVRHDSFVSFTWSSTVLYGVATVSRIDKIIGLFCRISSLS